MTHKRSSKLDYINLPRHIVIIMDGNGRWAKNKNLDRISGHREGMKAASSVVKAAKSLGIGYITLYAFSVQNWQRPKNEVSALMELLNNYLIKEGARLVEQDIRLNAIGRLDDLPRQTLRTLNNIIEKTSNCSSMTLTLALSYGGREEIIDAIRKLASSDNGRLENINENTFCNYLYTSDLPEPDLLIRTSGEMRLSNFMLWQLAYTEFYITRTLWPNFRKRHLIKAIAEYQKRERRFGKTGDQLSKKVQT